MNLDAVLKVRADVQGQGEIDGLSKSFGNLNRLAQVAQGGLSRMGQAAKGVSGLMSGLLAAVAAGGVVALGKSAIDAADDLNDMSQRTGVAVETLSRFERAAKDSGTSVETVAKAMSKLSKGLATAENGANTFGTAVQRSARTAEDAIKQSERRQIDAIRESTRTKIGILEDETDKRLRELNNRYREEQILLDDRFDDQADRQRQAADKALRLQERQIDRQFEMRRDAIESDKTLSDAARTQLIESLKAEHEDALSALADRNQALQKERERQLRDARRAEDNALQERKYAEEKALKDLLAAQKAIGEQSMQGQIEEIKKQAASQIAVLNGGGQSVRAALTSLGISAIDAQGKLMPLDAIMLEVADRFSKMEDGAQKSALAQDIFGRSGVELIPMLNNGREALEKYQATITSPMAKAADQFNESIARIQSAIARPFDRAVETALPAITKIAEGIAKVAEKAEPTISKIGYAIAGAIEAFSNLPGPVQNVILAVGGAIAALLALLPVIASVATIVAGFGPLFAAGGALASAGSIIAGLATAFIVLITGPVGIVALIVAAGVAIYAFRDQIGAAFGAVVNFIGNAFNTIGNLLKAGAKAYMDYYVKPILGFFKGLYDGAVDIFKKIGSAIGAAFKTVVDTIKAVFRSVLQYLASRVNAVTGLINILIAAFNRLPAPDIPLIPKLTVPEFAQGGVVSRPTLAMVGEGGEREYIVPESKMAAASANYLAGARGGNVLAGATAGGAPVINVTTGPVMEFNGERYVTVADMERAMRATANSVIGKLRTPSARIALGMA